MLTPEQIEKLVEQKMKLFKKTQTESAEYANIHRAMDTRDLFEGLAWTQEFDINWTALISSFSFGMAPAELEPLPIIKEPEMPSPEELEAGINLPVSTPAPESILEEIVKDVEEGRMELPAGVSIEDIKSAFESLPSANAGTFAPEQAEEITETTPEKAYYEKSHYDESYYDPPLMREFLRSAIFRMINDITDPIMLKNDLKKLAEQLGINEDVVRTVYNRIQLMRSQRYNQFILGLSVLGASTVTDERKVSFIDYDGNLVEVELNTAENSLLGMILGVTPLGYSFTTPPSTVIRPLNKVYPTGSKLVEPALPVILEYIHRKVDKTVINAFMNPITFTNYSTAEERTDVHKCEKMNLYHELQAFRYQVENMIDNICNKYSVGQFQKRQYKSAGLEYITRGVPSHSWGLDLFKQMSDDEFTEYWLNHWTSQGLNTSILKEIKEAIDKWYPNLGSLMRQRSAEFKLRRKLQALLKQQMRSP